MENINQKIRELINSKGVKLTAIATKTGYSTQNLNRILTSNDIKFSQLEAICKVLETDIYQFLASDYVNTGVIESVFEENKALKDEKRRIVKNSIGFDQLRKIEKIIENKALLGLGLIYLEHDSINNVFQLVFAPLSIKIVQNEYFLIEKCAIENYLDMNLSDKGFVLESLR